VAGKAYFTPMNITVKEAETRFAELLRRAEAGEKVVMTRDGEAVAELAPISTKKGGINWDALEAYKKKHGIKKFVEFISDDFDDPLPEDFLVTPEK
jgi:antitoxin (DNA-binding transcriptional repressor) of toxin-antitoxin stability system